MSKQLNEPITENGIRNTNFFNGRLLTAKDLQTDQEAERSQRWQLGRAIGEGIVEGLIVTIVNSGSATAPPLVSVTKGLAINRKGQMLALGSDTTIALARNPEVAPVEAGIFAECLVLPRAVDTGTGAYLLVVSPSSVFQESAPMISIAPDRGLRACGKRFEIEGVRFRLLKLPNLPPELVDSTGNAAGTLRNRIAHFCFGSHKMLAGTFDPFVLRPALSALDLIRTPEMLTDCDVPIAVVHWTTTADFQDIWAVRRPSAIVDEIFHPDQKLVYASVRQFQEQFSTLTSLETLEVARNFFFLPPFGRLPVRDSINRSATGVDLKRFWGLKYKGFPSVINRQELVPLLRTASDYAPRRLTAVDTVELFVVAEQMAAVHRGAERQLYAYYAFGEIARRFCAPARVARPDFDVKLGELMTTIEGAIAAYQGFRELFLLNLVARDRELTRQDAEGLQAIDQVLAVAHSIVAAACGCMSNLCLWLNYKRLAAQEKRFADTWLDVVLAQNEGSKYPAAISVLIRRVQSLIDSSTIEGIHGLRATLANNDLFETNLAQIKINQSFNVQVATGAHGSMTVTYVTAPVLPPNPGGGSAVLVEGTYMFVFRVTATIDQEVTLRLAPSIAASGWNAELWEDAIDSPRSSDTITMPLSNNVPGGRSQDVRVRVTVPSVAAGASTGLLMLDVTETSGGGGVPPGHAELLLTIGQDVPRPDNRVGVSLGNIGALSMIGSRLSLPRSTLSGVQFVVRLTVAGQFTCSLVNANTGQSAWTQLRVSVGTATINVPGTPGAPVAGGAVNQLVQGLMHPGSAAENTDLLFSLQSNNIPGSPVDQRFRLSVAIQG